MIYINGIRATNKDLKRLWAEIKAGRNRAKGHVTKSGNLAIVTEF